MSTATEIAIIAALEREVWPLVKHWQAADREHDGRRYRFYRQGRVVLVCGGMGQAAARRATEAAIALFQPAMVYSVGFAGALVPTLQVGAVVAPTRVIDAGDSSVAETGEGQGVLVTCSTVASVAQKAKLAQAYNATAVDMEASAVAKGAQARGVRFLALKAISDDSNFALPDLEPFLDGEGRFRTAGFVLFVALRPWLWRPVARLAANSSKAAQALCASLSEMCEATGRSREVGN